ncbi:MAG TPA: 1,4-alpha-glucan branching protein GlgB, partial [Gemmatimonadaceae bacterium]|nr:1,4-alpha-glucan branching protein GlgB [Gemmatimonadaceae bacterium]
HPLHPRGTSGIWDGVVPEARTGALYKYSIESHRGGRRLEKADPFAFEAEVRPRTASRVCDLSGYPWGDGAWMADRGRRHHTRAPISIYEVHLGSWMRVPEEGNRWLTYRELAPRLAAYVSSLGYTHVELMPVMEHPFDGSWGYQSTGYFAPTSRFGSPHDFMYFVDTLHRAGVGVLLDWVPAHFPMDAHGLALFDGTHLYEHEDPRRGHHPDWDTAIYNYGRHEVRAFLLSSALFWLDRYHADGLRVDAVASMLYLDYSRPAGTWLPNPHGGRENLEAVSFLREMNERIYGEYPGALTAAEESTSWPMVSRPTSAGGLGFGFKWDMGWMNDTLEYMAKDPVHRRFHHDALTFRLLYASHENFVLPLSHDEVVHGKRSLLERMPGDDWQRFANLRLLHAWMYAQPGKKLLFMGGEMGQRREWNHDGSLDWHLLEAAPHRGVHRMVGDLNRIYRDYPALHELDCEGEGFEWVDCSDRDQSIVSLLRKGTDPDQAVLWIFNFTPVPRPGYRVGVPWAGTWVEILNSDAAIYGGSGQGNLGGLATQPQELHGRRHAIQAVVPPLAAVAFHGWRPSGS